MQGPDRRRFLKGTGAVGMTGLFAGCSSVINGNGGQQEQQEQQDPEQEGGEGAEQTDELPEIEMTLAHGYSLPHQSAFASRALKEYVESRSDGRITVDVAGEASLGDDIEQIEQVLDGTIEATTAFEGAMAPFYANINIINLPFLFPGPEVGNYVFDREFGDRFWEDMRESIGLRNIGHYDNGGARNFTTVDAPLRSIDDFEGLQIRAPPGAAPNQELVRQLGAEPVGIDGTEIYSALDQGVADGQENAIPIITSLNFYEVQDFCLLDGHMYTQNQIVVNDDWFQDLPEVYQAIIEAGGRHGALQARAATAAARNTGVTLMEQEGMEVHNPSSEFREDMVDAAQEPVTDVIRDAVDDEMWVDELFEAAEEAAEELGY